MFHEAGSPQQLFGTCSCVWDRNFCSFRRGENQSMYPKGNLTEQGRKPVTNLSHTRRRLQDLNPGHIRAHLITFKCYFSVLQIINYYYYNHRYYYYYYYHPIDGRRIVSLLCFSSFPEPGLLRRSISWNVKIVATICNVCNRNKTLWSVHFGVVVVELIVNAEE